MAGAFDQIKKKIQEAKKESSTFTDLDLTDIPINKFTPEIKALIEESKTIQVLYLTNCGLTTLQGFPNIVNLVAIDLSKNKIGDDGNIEALLSFPDLTQIIFTDNNVEKVETVLKLSTLSKLIEIDFEGNPVSKVDNYREDVFEKFQNIEFVDRKDKDGKEQQVEEEEFNDEDDDDEEEYELEENEDDEDEDFQEEEEESDEKPKKRGRKPK